MNSAGKIVSYADLADWRGEVGGEGRRLVVTNGCFDILHAGHVRYLEEARSRGDVLLVGLNGDQSVRQLKGAGRPINPERDRAVVLAALQAVDAVCIFQDRDAAAFLAVAKPDVYVKGGDYTLETLNPCERSAVERGGGQIVLVPFVEGKSTTGVLRRISELNGS